MGWGGAGTRWDPMGPGGTPGELPSRCARSEEELTLTRENSIRRLHSSHSTDTRTQVGTGGHGGHGGAWGGGWGVLGKESWGTEGAGVRTGVPVGLCWDEGHWGAGGAGRLGAHGDRYWGAHGVLGGLGCPWGVGVRGGLGAWGALGVLGGFECLWGWVLGVWGSGCCGGGWWCWMGHWGAEGAPVPSPGVLTWRCSWRRRCSCVPRAGRAACGGTACGGTACGAPASALPW